MPGNEVRKFLVRAFLAGVLLGSVAAFLADGFAGWPFVAYNMYARLPLSEPRTYYFVGVAPDGSERVLDGDSWFRPYFRQDFVSQLNALFPRERETLGPVLDALAETIARSGHPLRSVKILRATWLHAGDLQPELLPIGERRLP